ncbi:MAG: cob(I)yrinic acid a,c-diamide adenosyltransferase [Bacteroidales bacterium]|nr:cob(I)yrinic acid a,c-diamide adenosyltransferase [Bacteroidales bacterium]
MKKAVIYTARGDGGETSLVRGERVCKDDARVEAYGTMDELCAHVALLQSEIPSSGPAAAMLCDVQKRLFSIAAFLADTAPCVASPIDEHTLVALERIIDALEASLPRLNGFLLPSTVKAAAVANVCRTVCRRAERRIVTLHRASRQPQMLLAYMNRLSDYFFLLSRELSGGDEKKWEKPCE